MGAVAQALATVFHQTTKFKSVALSKFTTGYPYVMYFESVFCFVILRLPCELLHSYRQIIH